MSNDTPKHIVDSARKNSRQAASLAFLCSLLLCAAIAMSFYLSVSRSQVSVYPIGTNWDYPMADYVNIGTSYEETTKPIHVALKYVRGLYEVSPGDFSSVRRDDDSIMISDRLSDLLAYAAPGTEEVVKVTEALEKSYAKYLEISSCNCAHRFLVSDIMISNPPLPVLRVELIGRYVIFSKDGYQPLPIEDLGYKSIVLFMAHGLPMFDFSASSADTQNSKAPGTDDDTHAKNIADDRIQPINPEGWMVVRSRKKTLTSKEVNEIRKTREQAGLYKIY